MPFHVNSSTPEREAAAKDYLGGTTRLSIALRIVCTDGDIFAFTNEQFDRLLPSKTWRLITIPEALYRAGEATFPKHLQQSRDPRQVDTWEFVTFCGETEDDYVKTQDIAKNKFRDAAFSLIAYARDADFAWLLMRGEIGQISPDKGQAVWKANGLSRRFKQEVLEVTSPVARARWSDSIMSFFNLNGLTADGHTARVTGAASSVDAKFPRRKFRVTASTSHPEHRFTDGTCLFLTGANAGYEGSILNWNDSNGEVILDDYAPFPVANGDSVRLQIRIPQTIEEWVLFFGNGKYFPAEPGIPGNEIANRMVK